MEILDIKKQLTIEQVLNYYGLQPTSSGMLKCPFHESKSSKKTLQIYYDTNRYQCFHKECEAGNGDVIDFIRYKEKLTAHQAIQKAKSMITPVISDARSDVPSRSKEDYRSSGTSVVSETGAGNLLIESAHHYSYRTDTLQISVLGGIKLEGLDRMRATLKLATSHQSIRQNIDLYHDDQVQKLVRKAAERLEVGSSKLNAALYDLINQLESYRLEQLSKQNDHPKEAALTESERKAAEAFLKTENLLNTTNDLLGQSGIIGEEINRQLLWLVYSSRKRSKPLHVMCLGSSGTGKTYLQEQVARFIPETEKFSFTTGSENAFYYLGQKDLMHKLVLIEDLDGAQNLLYPLRELQTKQWISKVVPVKDMQGNMKTKKFEVYGPITLSGTTTQEKLYEDNANRCLLLYLDNSSLQQEKIMSYQRALSANKIDEEKEESAIQLLSHIQRVLEPIKVVNPYAEKLQLPKSCFKPLRTNEHYLQVIETITWYHQYQRELKADEHGEAYIETTLEDIRSANYLLKEVLLGKSDVLTHAERKFFERLKHHLKTGSQTSFYSKQIREALRMYPMQLNRYVRSLEHFGYVKKVGGNRKHGYEYEVLHWEEYEALKAGIDVLDELLLSITNV